MLKSKTYGKKLSLKREPGSIVQFKVFTQLINKVEFRINFKTLKTYQKYYSNPSIVVKYQTAPVLLYQHHSH